MILIIKRVAAMKRPLQSLISAYKTQSFLPRQQMQTWSSTEGARETATGPTMSTRGFWRPCASTARTGPRLPTTLGPKLASPSTLTPRNSASVSKESQTWKEQTWQKFWPNQSSQTPSQSTRTLTREPTSAQSRTSSQFWPPMPLASEGA